MPGRVLITWKAARSTLPVGVLRTGYFTVGIAGLYHKATQEEGLAVVRRACSSVMPLCLRGCRAGGIAVDDVVVVGVGDGGFGNVVKFHFNSHTLDFFGVTDKDDVGDFFSENHVGGLEGARFCSFGKHDALAVSLGFLW